MDCVGLTRSPDRDRLHASDRIAFRAEALRSSSVILAARALPQRFLLIERSSDARPVQRHRVRVVLDLL
jgi:hypothetical protein